MAPYWPFTIVRSDGQFDVVGRSNIKEPNQPTAAQLNDTPDANGNVDCYRKIEPDDAKAVDWRRKLGGMYMHLLGGKEWADRNYILSELPEGYVLWEHVKYNAKKLAEDKREKGKHAAGVFERQDAYLYGHPHGRKKRFRSPADFFPHMLWLSTDEQGDPRNCSCKICSPDGDEEVEELVKAEAPVKRENKPVPVAAAPQRIAQPQVQVQAQAPAPSKPTFQPALATTSKTHEQRLDSEPNGKYIYRPGELVWFNNVANWRLGVISKRGLRNNKPRYLLQPLSNPFHHQPYQIKDDESAIRPWLAWSVPNTTIPQIQNLTYDQVPWEQIVRGELDNGQSRDYIVDGSILAAKVIDSSYSLFDRIEGALAGPGEAHYKGMFLGAEKVWVGEPVRLRVPGSDLVVLIISKLIERAGPPNTSVVTFVGDVYKFVEMPTPYKNRSEWPTPALPPRMVVDLRFRNEVADTAKKGIWYEWRLLEPAARRGLSDVKGRWYETRSLLPILRGESEFQKEVRSGITSDAGTWMNGRRDKNNNPEQRKRNRKDTLGRAVPPDLKVSRGLDGPAVDDAFPDVQPVQAAPPLSFVESDIDQFMDLDQATSGHEFYGGNLQH
ncbi:Cryptic loci regulator [Lachnellula suecica]|uniref:Cryptic loci regulator n=1 Tax=Lachnellula suecica TaxID=602035 RepID=A0A8T9C8R4_9HELO|nr:Cryptic loci regulator [Lachnellula suecica]